MKTSPSRIVILSFVLFSTILGQQDSMATSQQEATAGEFKIQDYVPGEFSARLRWIDLGTGSFSNYIKTGGKGLDLEKAGSSRIGNSEFYAQPNFGFQQSVRKENRQKVSNLDFQFSSRYDLHYRMQTDSAYQYGNWDNWSRSVVDSRSNTPSIVSRLSWNTKRFTTGNLFLGASTFLLGSVYDGNSALLSNRYSISMEDAAGAEPTAIRRDTNDNKSDRYFSRIFVDFSFLAGRGRIYNGLTTWRAFDLIREISSRRGLDLDELPARVVEQLAEVLYKIRTNKYAWREASRLREYERTEEVIALIESVPGLANLVPSEVALVHDILRYYPTFNRDYGSQLNIAIGGRYNEEYLSDSFDRASEQWVGNGSQLDSVFYYTAENRTERRNRKLVNPQLTINYSVFRPIDMARQLNHTFGAQLSVEQRREANYYTRIYSRSGYASDTTESFTRDPGNNNWRRWYRNLRLWINVNYIHVLDSRTYWIASLTVNNYFGEIISHPGRIIYPYYEEEYNILQNDNLGGHSKWQIPEGTLRLPVS